MLLNKNLTGTPEEKEEALAKQAKAWARVQEVGDKLHRIFLANHNLRMRWIKQVTNFQKRFEEVGNAQDADAKAEAILKLVWVVYGINDAEGRVGSMLSNMTGSWVNPKGQAKASSVIYGSNVTIASMGDAERFLVKLR